MLAKHSTIWPFYQHLTFIFVLVYIHTFGPRNSPEPIGKIIGNNGGGIENAKTTVKVFVDARAS